MDNATGRTAANGTPYIGAKPVAPEYMPKVVALLKEIRQLKELRDEATDGATKEEMQVEVMKLVAEVNNSLKGMCQCANVPMCQCPHEVGKMTVINTI